MNVVGGPKSCQMGQSSSHLSFKRLDSRKETKLDISNENKVGLILLQKHKEYDECYKKYDVASFQAAINLLFLVLFGALTVLVFHKSGIKAPEWELLLYSGVVITLYYALRQEHFKRKHPERCRKILFWRIKPFDFYSPLIREIEGVAKEILEMKDPEGVWSLFPWKLEQMADTKLSSAAEEIVFIEEAIFNMKKQLPQREYLEKLAKKGRESFSSAYEYLLSTSMIVDRDADVDEEGKLVNPTNKRFNGHSHYYGLAYARLKMGGVITSGTD